jgi:hypothetical protein
MVSAARGLSSSFGGFPDVWKNKSSTGFDGLEITEPTPIHRGAELWYALTLNAVNKGGKEMPTFYPWMVVSARNSGRNTPDNFLVFNTSQQLEEWAKCADPCKSATQSKSQTVGTSPLGQSAPSSSTTNLDAVASDIKALRLDVQALTEAIKAQQKK